MRDSLVKRFESIVGKGNLFSEREVLYAYSYDAAVVPQTIPELVIRPMDPEAASKVIRVCNEEDIPITVRGSGTNLSGGAVPSPGGIVILTNALNRILELNEADLYAVVEPGVITAKFASLVESKGLFYPPDPGSQSVSTLGGNVAENAGGLRGLKYGVTKDYVMGLELFDAEGNPIKTGSRTVKCVTGYNLSGLITGSEGTLGFIYKIILKLLPYPRHRKAMVVYYDDVMKASITVSEIIGARILPCTLEFMDNFTIRAVEAYSKAGLPTDAAALLLIEVDGHPSQVEEDSLTIEALCRRNGALQIKVAGDQRERDRVWEARRGALSALAKLRPTVILEDATVPRSRIPDMVKEVQTIAKRHQLLIGTFGHAGDGNLHPTILTDKRDREEWKRVEKAIEEIFEAALALGGTLSGEHGIGIAKSKYLEKETNRYTLLYSQKIKRALDPKSIFNPGKVLYE